MPYRINELTKATQVMAHKFLDIMECHDQDVLIYCAYRSMVEQAILYRRGKTIRVIRAKVKELNEARPGLGDILVKVGPQMEKISVTNAGPGQSAHNYHIAFDGVPMLHGKPLWDSDDLAWKIYGLCAKKAGLEWAGEWKSFKEYPHCQMKRFDWRKRVKLIRKDDLESAIASAEQFAIIENGN